MSFFEGHTPLSSARRKTLRSVTRKDCWTTQLSVSACSKAASQKTGSTAFGTLHPLSMTEFIVIRLNGAEHSDWMQCRQSLRMAIDTGNFSQPGVIDVVWNIIGV